MAVRRNWALKRLAPLDDTIIGTGDDDTLAGTSGRDIIEGRGGADVLSGLEEKDRIDGGVGQDILFGHEGPDRLNGGSGHDTLVGGKGADDLIGGLGDDVFRFERRGESTPDKTDLIFRYEGEDRIDVSDIDADKLTPGAQQFGYVPGLTGEAGQLAWRSNGAGGTIIEGDVDGDAIPDFRIEHPPRQPRFAAWHQRGRHADRV